LQIKRRFCFLRTTQTSFFLQHSHITHALYFFVDLLVSHLILCYMSTTRSGRSFQQQPTIDDDGPKGATENWVTEDDMAANDNDEQGLTAKKNKTHARQLMPKQHTTAQQDAGTATALSVSEEQVKITRRKRKSTRRLNQRVRVAQRYQYVTDILPQQRLSDILLVVTQLQDLLAMLKTMLQPPVPVTALLLVSIIEDELTAYLGLLRVPDADWGSVRISFDLILHVHKRLQSLIATHVQSLVTLIMRHHAQYQAALVIMVNALDLEVPSAPLMSVRLNDNHVDRVGVTHLISGEPATSTNDTTSGDEEVPLLPITNTTDVQEYNAHAELVRFLSEECSDNTSEESQGWDLADLALLVDI
jgi:hypothetical protein